MKKLILFASLLLQSMLMYANTIDLFINDQQMVLLSFPSEVKYVDFGSADIKGKKTAHKNILQIKSDIPHFEETTASVVTADGNYYSFLLKYKEYTPFLAIDIAKIKNGVINNECCSKMEFMQLNDIKTSHIIVNEKVTDIIVALDSVIADYADNIDNIIKCKTTSANCPLTTLSIITKNGYMVPIQVSYSAKPEKMNLNINSPLKDKVEEESDSTKNASAIFNDKSVNDKQLKAYGSSVIVRGAEITNIGVISQNMLFGLYGVFIKKDIMMFHFNLENSSQIDYEIDFIKMYIADEKKDKKIAQQEEELTPIFTYAASDNMTVKGKSNKSFVYFFKRFTIPEKRVLYIEAFEKNGGRHIKFKISNKVILNAKQF